MIQLPNETKKRGFFSNFEVFEKSEYCDKIVLDPSTAFASSAFEDKVVKISVKFVRLRRCCGASQIYSENFHECRQKRRHL